MGARGLQQILLGQGGLSPQVIPGHLLSEEAKTGKAGPKISAEMQKTWDEEAEEGGVWEAAGAGVGTGLLPDSSNKCVQTSRGQPYGDLASWTPS